MAAAIGLWSSLLLPATVTGENPATGTARLRAHVARTFAAL